MLREDGVKIGRFRVRRLMRELGLVSKQPGSHAYKQATVERPDIPNCLNREFTTETPNQVWCGDITYVWTSTVTVQCLAFALFAKLRSSPVTTLLSAHFTCAKLLTVLLGLKPFEATHNPLVHGSSPCGPTIFKAAHCAVFSCLKQKQPSRHNANCGPNTLAEKRT